MSEARLSREEALASGDPKRIAEAEMWLGAALFEGHLVAAALPCFEQAAAAYERAGLQTEILMARLNQARTLTALGRDDEAVAIYEDISSRPVGTDETLYALVVSAWHRLSEHHERLGDTHAADAALARAGALAATRGADEVLRHDHSVTNVLYERRDPSAAARYADLARRYVAAKRLDEAANCLFFQGGAHQKAGEFHEALDAYRKAHAHYQALGNQQGMESARQYIDDLGG